MWSFKNIFIYLMGHIVIDNIVLAIGGYTWLELIFQHDMFDAFLWANCILCVIFMIMNTRIVYYIHQYRELQQEENPSAKQDVRDMLTLLACVQIGFGMAMIFFYFLFNETGGKLPNISFSFQFCIWMYMGFYPLQFFHGLFIFATILEEIGCLTMNHSATEPLILNLV